LEGRYVPYSLAAVKQRIVRCWNRGLLLMCALRSRPSLGRELITPLYPVLTGNVVPHYQLGACDRAHHGDELRLRHCPKRPRQAGVPRRTVPAPSRPIQQRAEPRCVQDALRGYCMDCGPADYYAPTLDRFETACRTSHVRADNAAGKSSVYYDTPLDRAIHLIRSRTTTWWDGCTSPPRTE
jgi:hypothetical protein